MIFKLEIECVNAAFDDNPSPELVRILEWVTNDLSHTRLDTNTARVLRDINGNTVGSYILAKHVYARRFALVYQAGIANVFEVDWFSNDMGKRNARRVLQADFRTCENFTAGTIQLGAMVRVFSCNRAGDIVDVPWTLGLVDCPFRDTARPPRVK